MERMHSMFQNPFGSKAGQLIERGTMATLEQEDWAINMEIVDVIASYEDGPKDAVKAFRKRLSNNKSTKQLELTLSVLETCVKNCGLKFHILIMSRDFCNDVLVRMLNSKMNIPIVLQQRVLSLIQQWAETFKKVNALIGVVQVYNELLAQGHEFPKRDNRANVPILTPKRTHENQPAQPVVVTQMPQPGMPSIVQQPAQPQRVITNIRQPTTGPITPTQEQSAKLQSELEIVLGNVNVLSEMLTDLVPGQTDPSDLELLQELHRTCKAMQQRIVELVERIANEEITVELLRVNDDLNNVFLRYERFERYRENAKTTSPLQATTFQQPPEPYQHHPHNEPPPSYSTTEPQPVVVDNLIDFGPEPSAAQPQPVKPEQLSNDFDNLNLDQMLSTPNQPASYPNLSEDLAQFDSFSPQLMMTPDEEAEISPTEHEVEQWLDPVGALAQPNNYTQTTNNFETTDDFNAFLNERAKAGENHPNVTTTQQISGDSRQRNIQQDSQPMFGL